MFHRYFQLTVSNGKKCAFLNQAVFSEPGHRLIPTRGAGHAKWQNIKSTKEAADSNRSNTFQRITRQIVLAVKKGGEDASANSKLKSLIEEAQKVNMPKATIQKAILSAKNVNDQPYWIVFTGPRGVVLGLEVTFANRNHSYLNSKIAPQTKKLNLKMEPHFQEVCTEKGVVIGKGQSDDEAAFDKAMEDALAVGADDVYKGEGKSLIFECLPDRLDGVINQLTKLGYEIDSATIELDFVEEVNISEEEKKDIERIVGKLQGEHSEIVRAVYNAAG